jgi:Ca-activated chloride channel homolog
MSWGRPDALYLLWLLPLLLVFLVVALRARSRALARLGALAAGLSSPRAGQLHVARAALWFLAIVCGVVALAQPRWGFRWEELKREGFSLVVVLDVSSSMAAEDVSPSRMERARREVVDLAEQLEGDRVGLVLFAGGAYPRMPLTLDYNALVQMVDDSDTTTIRTQGSDMGAAIDAAVLLLGPAGPADRAILIISDGEDHSGRAVEAATKAAADGVRLYTLGVGTEDGAPIPVAGGGFKNDGDGRVVLSRLDEGVLQDVARAGGGAYARSVAGTGDVVGLYTDELRGKLQGAEQGVRRDKVWDERFQWPLAAAILLGLLGQALRPSPLRPRRLATAAALLLVLGVARAEQSAEVARLLAAQVEHPGDLGIAEQLGEALYKAGDYAAAERVLGDVAPRAPGADQGLAAYRGGDLTRAVERWKQVAPDAPVAGQAQQNAAAVSKEISLRQQEQQDQQDQQDQEQQDQDQQQEGQQGEPQDGQQGEPQDGQQGEPQDQPQDGQQGQEQQQDGQQGQAQPADPQQPGDPKPGEGGQIEAQDGGQDTGGEAGAAAQGAEQGGDKLSPDAAGRMVDGVQEGKPRMAVGADSNNEKDW